jgi:hypothetical protein
MPRPFLAFLFLPLLPLPARFLSLLLFLGALFAPPDE